MLLGFVLLENYKTNNVLLRGDKMVPDESALNQDVFGEPPKSTTPPLRMGSGTTEAKSTEDVFNNHRHLVQWVLDNGGYLHPQAQIAFSPRRRYHVVVTEEATLTTGTRIASCPMPVTLSVLNAFGVDPFPKQGTIFPKAFLRNQSKTPESLQAFYLMEQLVLGSRSWWAPYIATLPAVEDVTAMQFEEEADIMWLEGTNLKGGLSTQPAKWKEMYLQGSGQLKQLGWSNALNGSYTWYANSTRRFDSSRSHIYLGQSSAGQPRFSEVAPSPRKYLMLPFPRILLV